MRGVRFRKKPVVIEAWQIRKVDTDTTEILPVWLLKAIAEGEVETLADGALFVNTLEGQMAGGVGDWLIRGVKGELYPCKPEIFEATYELVADEPGQGG
jgi:hypothetical protein